MLTGLPCLLATRFSYTYFFAYTFHIYFFSNTRDRSAIIMSIVPGTKCKAIYKGKWLLPITFRIAVARVFSCCAKTRISPHYFIWAKMNFPVIVFTRSIPMHAQVQGPYHEGICIFRLLIFVAGVIILYFSVWLVCFCVASASCTARLN